MTAPQEKLALLFVLFLLLTISLVYVSNQGTTFLIVTKTGKNNRTVKFFSESVPFFKKLCIC